MTTIGFFIAGLIIGGIVAWLIASSRAKSSEAVNNELRQQIQQKGDELAKKDDELAKTRNELTNEKQARASMDARYQEAEKTF